MSFVGWMHRYWEGMRIPWRARDGRTVADDGMSERGEGKKERKEKDQILLHSSQVASLVEVLVYRDDHNGSKDFCIVLLHTLWTIAL